MRKNKPITGQFKPGKNQVLDKEDLEASKAKFRITFFLDVETLSKFKQFAGASGGKYQTLLNECLNECVDDFLRKRAKKISDAYLKKSKIG